MLTINLGIILLVALFGIPIIFKPREPQLKRLSGDVIEITNVGCGTLEGLPQFLLIGFLLMAIVMSAGELNPTRLSANAAILLTGTLMSLLSLFWLRSRYKSYRFDLAEAKAEAFVCQFGKARKARDYFLQKPLTASTVTDCRGDGVTFYWTQWNVVGDKPIKIAHTTDEERKRLRDWLRQNGCTVA